VRETCLMLSKALWGIRHCSITLRLFCGRQTRILQRRKCTIIYQLRTLHQNILFGRQISKFIKSFLLTFISSNRLSVHKTSESRLYFYSHLISSCNILDGGVRSKKMGKLLTAWRSYRFSLKSGYHTQPPEWVNR
jgi:hypothetical protein